MAKAIVRFEAKAPAAGEDHSGPGDPVCFFPIDQMPEIVERAERLRPFIPARQNLVDAPEKCLESPRGPTKNINCEVEAEFHGVLSGPPERHPSAEATSNPDQDACRYPPHQ